MRRRRGRVNLRRTPTCEMNLLFEGKQKVLIKLKNRQNKREVKQYDLP